MVEIEVYKYTTIQTTLGEMVVINEEDGAGKVIAQWFPIREQCRLLEMDADRQKRVVKEDYAAALREIPVELEVGWRRVLCIRKKEMALWLAGIDPSRCRLGARQALEEYRQELLAAADRIFWKHATLGSATALPPRSQAGVTVKIEVDEAVYCAHGAPHRVVVIDGKLYLELMED